MKSSKLTEPFGYIIKPFNERELQTSIEIALDEISKNKGKLYDPDVVEACVRVFKNKGFTFE